MKSSIICTIVAVLCALTISACSKPTWQRLTLPGSPELHDIADCAGQWYAVGAEAGRPAAWTSTDARQWTSVAFRPLAGSYYGPHEVIMSVACAAGRVAMVGAIPGGAHGNPRVSTWRLDGGAMVENQAPFETYGGDNAVDVGQISAGSRGFAIAGDRSSGAATWLSPDGRDFTLHLLKGRQTMARDAAELPDGRWAIVGGDTVPGSLDETAAVWLTTDGTTWTRDDPPARSGFNELQRVTRDGDDLLAAGAQGTAFVVWRLHDGTWTAGSAFGGDPGGVRSLTVAGGKPVVAGGGLWVGGQVWPVPATPVAVAGRGDTLIMATGDSLFSSDIAASGR